MPEYDALSLKTYPRWILYLSSDQYFLGRTYAWLRREGRMQRLSTLTREEVGELHAIVLPQIESALEQLWQPDHMNYAWLGNQFREHQGHGHMHIIPRYAKKRDFLGIEFVDEFWGYNYAHRPPRALPVSALHDIRDKLRNTLNTADH